MFNTSLDNSSTLEPFHARIIGKSAVTHDPQVATSTVGNSQYGVTDSDALAVG
jgi:hypothetical protein